MMQRYTIFLNKKTKFRFFAGSSINLCNYTSFHASPNVMGAEVPVPSAPPKAAMPSKSYPKKEFPRRNTAGGFLCVKTHPFKCQNVKSR